MKLLLPILFLGGTLCAADITLPLQNGGFENGLEGWTVEASDPSVVQVLPEAASLGAKGLRLRTLAQGGSFQVSSTPLPVNAGESYSVTFWSGGSADRPGKAAVEMIFKDDKGAILKPAMAKIRKWPAGGAQGGRFFQSSQLAAAAPQGAVSLVVTVRPARQAADGMVDIDDFQVLQLGEIKPMERGPDGAAPIPLSDPERLAALEKEISADPFRGKAPPKIVIKLDDLGPRNGQVHPQWIRVADYMKSKNLPLTFGIVAKEMEQDAPAFFQWVKDRHADGRIEFWNHGWDHAEWKDAAGKAVQEFNGTGYDHQKQHLGDANRLAREKLGFPFVSFGAPFNATDADTAKVLQEDPDIKVWMYGDKDNPAGKTVLERCYAVTIESPTFVPNYADFLEGYAHNRGAEYFVMQGHPTHWNEDRWNQFTHIIDFLSGQKVEFVKASDFAKK